MKLILVLAAVFGLATAQRSDFVDYVIDLQYAVGFIHDYIQDTTWQARSDKSAELTNINENGVLHIFNGLSSLIPTRDATDEAIEVARGTGNEDCINDVVNVWEQQLAAAGVAIQTCGNQHMSGLYSNTTEYHDFINSHRQIQFDAQNIVVQTFTGLNPMTDVMDLSPRVEQGIDEVYDIFEADAHPGFQLRTENFRQLSVDIPAEIEACVAEALVVFAADAASAVETVQAC